MTPVEMTKVSVDRVKKISDIIESAVAGMNVEVFRGDKDVDIRSANEKKAYRLTTDGVHTSPEGAAMIAEYLASKILR